MVWFDFLKTQGLFHPSLNPDPIETENGFRVMYWPSLAYLEKLSDEIQKGKYLEAIPEILAIIEDVSKQPKDNYNTWYSFLSILSKIPNSKIPLSFLNHIPGWFNSRFDTMLQSSGVCELLLPKFLNDRPNDDDSEKAEAILYYLFSIKKRSGYQESVWDGDGDSYQSLVHLHNVRETIAKEELRTKIVTHCSTNSLLQLARNLKFILFDFPKGIIQPVNSEHAEYRIRTVIEVQTLRVWWKSKEGDNEERELGTIGDYDALEADAIRREFANLLKGLPEPPTEESQSFYLERMEFSLTTDYFSAFAHDPIHALDERGDSEKLTEVFALLFRDLLLELCKQKPVQGHQFLEQLHKEKRFNHPFFKRMIIHVVGQYYEQYKTLFWQMVHEDSDKLFSKEYYYADLFHFFENNGSNFSDDEFDILESIFNRGVQEKHLQNNDTYREHWLLSWYSALKDSSRFKELYNTFSAKLNTTSDDFKERNRVRVRVGHVTPFTPEEILQKSVAEIIANIQSFVPGDRWEGPSVEGYADSLGKAVEKEPERFAADALMLAEVPLPYVDAFLYGLANAWRKKMGFDWTSPLELCYELLKKRDQSKETNGSQNVYRIDQKLIAGTIGWLLSEGLRDDANAFHESLLPLAKQVLLAAASFIQPDTRQHQSDMDYVTHSLNTSSGKLLRAYLDYALRKARIDDATNTKKGDDQIHSVFDISLQSNIVEAFTILGMYYEQFFYLDESWLTEKVFALYDVEGECWVAFLNGMGFARAPFTKALYTLFYPHYSRAIQTDSGLKDHHNRGLLLHLVAFYFREFEALSPQSLVGQIIFTSDSTMVKALCTKIWQQEKYLVQCSEREQEALRKKVLAVWEAVLDRFKTPETKSDEELLEHLLDLAGYIQVLTTQTADLLVRTLAYSSKPRHFHSLVEDLTRLKTVGPAAVTASFLGKVLEVIPLPFYWSGDDKSKFIELITFLFSNDQQTAANKICNKVSIQGHQFLNGIYRKYNQ